MVKEISTLSDIFDNPDSFFVAGEVSRYEDERGKSWEEVDIGKYLPHLRAGQLFLDLLKVTDSLGLNPEMRGYAFKNGEYHHLDFTAPISNPKSYRIKIENGKVSLQRKV